MIRIAVLLALLCSLSSAASADTYPHIRPGDQRPDGFFQYEWAPMGRTANTRRLHQFDDLTARQPWSLTAPDRDTIRLEVRPDDQMWWDRKVGSGSERAEIAASYDGVNDRPKGPGRIPVRTVAHFRFGMTLEPGPSNTAS